MPESTPLLHQHCPKVRQISQASRSLSFRPDNGPMNQQTHAPRHDLSGSSQAQSTTTAGNPAAAPVAEYAITGVDGRDMRLRVWMTQAASGTALASPTAQARTAAAHVPGATPAASTATPPPLHPAPFANAFPTLLLLDGQWLTDTIGNALPQLADTPLLIASLGFSTGERSFTAPWRARDYTPASPDPRQCDPRNDAWPCGGADTLLDLLRSVVLPLLQHEHRADPLRTALFGHSYAGLFSTYAWLNAPGLFCHIYSASPSLWWYWPHALDLIATTRTAPIADDGVAPGSTPAAAADMPASPPAAGREAHTRQAPGRECNPADESAPAALPPLQLLVGADERWRPLPAEPGMPRPEGISTIPFAEQFLQALKTRYPHARTHLDILPDLAHGPMLHASAARCMLGFGALQTRN